ncbi:MAG: HAMP domain-containing sensor histidine kinase [Planctomycetota bacterium]|nr:HAMP domain-containing sensor histidine kinase [Planctomycetota bacterium]
MARSLLALWTTLALAILALCVVAQFWIHQRGAMAKQRVEEILMDQLVPVSRSISDVIEAYSIELQNELEDVDLNDLDQCVELKRLYLADAVIVVDEESQLYFPVEPLRETRDKQSLIDEAMQLLREQVAIPSNFSKNPQLTNNTASQSAQSLNSNVGRQTPANDSNGEEWTQQMSANSAPSFENSSQAGQIAQRRGPAPRRSKIYYGNAPPLMGQSADSNAASQDLPDPFLPFEQAEAQTEEKQLAIQSGGSQLEQNQGENFDPQFPNGRAAGVRVEPDFGWITWYHRREMILGFWCKQVDGMRAIVALPTARWKADILAKLPDPKLGDIGEVSPLKRTGTLAGSARQLVDVEGQLIHHWGGAPREFLDDARSQPPTAEIAVQEPLEGWRLRVVATEELIRRLAGDSMVAPIWSAVVGVSLALCLGGWLVTINVNRQFRLAASRVSFVNQVSHELRTPLTNICMYADLLANDLSKSETWAGVRDNVDPKLERLGVIQSESRRLNRLIGNVLEFARVDSKKPLQTEVKVLDDLVREVLATFAPRFEELGFEVEFVLQAAKARQLAADAVEQILVNLISNAEKYAFAGKWLRVTTSLTGDDAVILIEDRGPGIPDRMTQKIFSPFERISDRLEDPAGTGIGLSIVRELARKHGGDCKLLPSQEGASFRCTLHAPETH